MRFAACPAHRPSILLVDHSRVDVHGLTSDGEGPHLNTIGPACIRRGCAGSGPGGFTEFGLASKNPQAPCTLAMRPSCNSGVSFRGPDPLCLCLCLCLCVCPKSSFTLSLAAGTLTIQAAQSCCSAGLHPPMTPRWIPLSCSSPSPRGPPRVDFGRFRLPADRQTEKLLQAFLLSVLVSFVR